MVEGGGDEPHRPAEDDRQGCAEGKSDDDETGRRADHPQSSVVPPIAVVHGAVSPGRAGHGRLSPLAPLVPIGGRRRAREAERLQVEIEDLTSTEPMLQEGPRPKSRVQVLTIVGIVIVLLFAGLVGILKVRADGYYVLSPGQAPVVTALKTCHPSGGGSYTLPGGTPCVQLVLPPSKVNATTGPIMMVDVFEGKPNPWQFLLYKLGLLDTFENDAQFVPNKYIIGNGTAAQLSCQNTQQAVEATNAAPVAALRRLGYTVKEEDLGAQIDTVVPGTPAAAAGLQCNDLITSINGKAVRTAADVASALKGDPPGTVAKIAVTRDGPNGAARSLDLTATLGQTPAIDGQAANPHQGFLGIKSETRTKYDFPFPVSVQVGSIGGPSDGLALALGLIQHLGYGHLTGGLRIAATGEISPDGEVIEIGGASQKAVAVRHAGAQVFFVPTANYADAKKKAGSMKVFAVNSLDQALQDLRSLGGQIPPAPAATTAVEVTG